MKKALLLIFTGCFVSGLLAQNCDLTIGHVIKSGVIKSNGTHTNDGDLLWICKGITLDVSGASNEIWAEENCNITLSGDDNILHIKRGGTVTVTGDGNNIEDYQNGITPVDNGTNTTLGSACDAVFYDYSDTPSGANACPAKYVGIRTVKQVSNDVSIYPNPVADVLYLKLRGSLSISSYQLYSITGQIELSETVNGRLESIDMSGIQPGLYFLQLQTSEGIKSHRLTVQ